MSLTHTSWKKQIFNGYVSEKLHNRFIGNSKLRKTRRPFINLILSEMHFEIGRSTQPDLQKSDYVLILQYIVSDIEHQTTNDTWVLSKFEITQI